MVSTRRRRSVIAPESAPTELINSRSSPTRLVEPFSSTHNPLGDDGTETIGSRLRKRRRTGMSPNDGNLSTPKSLVQRKATSTNKKKAEPAIALVEAPREQPHSSPLDHQPHNAKHLLQDILPHISGQGSMALRTTSRQGMDGNKKSPGNMADQSSSPDANPHFQEHQPMSAAGPDLAAVIANIIEHGEAVERRYNEMGYVDTESFGYLGASHHLKTQSLPILDNLATQILNTLAKSTYQEILTIATDPESESGQAYATLKSLFDHTKRVYSIQDPFLSPYDLELVEPAHVDTIRKANMATFVSSVFGSQDVGFYYLNEYFLDTFVADGNKLLKSQAQLFLDLKTQAYISATSNGERQREDILEDLFPTNLEERLLCRRPGARQLAPSEADFLQRARNRRKALFEEPQSEEAIAGLPEKYVWENFLRDVSAYVSKNFASMVGASGRRSARSGRTSNFFGNDHPRQHQQRRSSYHRQEPEHTLQQDHVRPSTEIPEPSQGQVMMDTDDIAEKAARAAHFAIQGFDVSQPEAAPQYPSPIEMQPMPHQPQNFPYHFEQSAPPEYYHQSPYQQSPQMQPQLNHQPVDISNQPEDYGDQNEIPYPTQSAPTQVLYERARMAATAKASPSCRRAGHPSQRRPWTTDEENALMAGLDRVKGPHWSQILAMFGPGGTINETLKDRNQVQLKDKARNLKLFFLKSNIEVPYYLSFVTGELKTRAPAQAAKNEAKQKERVSEDRAHMEGMMTLPWHSAQDGEQAVDPENGVEEGCVHNVIDPETEGRPNGTQTEFEKREGTLEVMNNESSIDNIGSIQQRYHRAGSNSHVNGDLIYQNKALENLLAEASHAGLNEVTKIENLVA